MYRRVVLYGDWINGPFDVLYHVRGAWLLSQRRVSELGFEQNFSASAAHGAVVYPDSVRLKTNAPVGPNRTFEFALDVSENQPAEESVEELSSTGVAIAVYNEHGVLVCRNVPKTPASGAPEQTDVPGEMTSVPGEEPGEMI